MSEPLYSINPERDEEIKEEQRKIHSQLSKRFESGEQLQKTEMLEMLETHPKFIKILWMVKDYNNDKNELTLLGS